MAKLTEVPARAPTWAPSASSGSGSDIEDDDDHPFELSEQDRLNILHMHPDLKPSQLPSGKGSGKTPLVILDPEELHRLAATGQTKEGEEGEEEEYEVVEEELWEEVVNCVLWSIPFSFLFYCMNVAAHKQFGQDHEWKHEIWKLANFAPALLLLNFLASRPKSKALLPPIAIQALFAALCVGTGSSLIHTTTTESYRGVIQQAPPLGVLWVWSVVRMDLSWALASLLGVAAIVWARGDKVFSA